ncbi:uncharacterized protein LOC116426453 [Nomia melanderi]|uniref:uncharacterized protein LOC116426453 n=1 Tax=Nomia melanderi TaxID=2448451 RepID=UPI0013045BF0|nr:uncharacterized protein LOC116426453 [Nomia melanderi]XP_031831284.1 uncharacterized protein LOC116426453 [Nomia melanderi]XP_031831285.1 uncharacterized protein LOC116426453 [Nomia melanderi]
MNNSTIGIVFVLCAVLCISEAMEPNIDGGTKMSRAQNKIYNHHPSGGLVSFNSEDEKIHLDWSVNIPFISIPLDQKIGDHSHVPSLLNVNTKALGMVGLLTTLLSVVPSLFTKTKPHTNYRSVDDSQWQEFGNAINGMIFNNEYVTPCIQRVVCTIVSMAAHSDSPTSTDKIIDGLSSHKWFKDVTNGTMIEDAVDTGRMGGHDCARVYRSCVITPTLLRTVMNEFGIA